MRMRWLGVSSAVVIGGLAAPALAQGFAPGMTLFPVPQGYEGFGAPRLSSDGTAIGTYYYNTTTRLNTAVTIRPTGVTELFTPARVNDISDGGAFTVDYATRYDASGTPQVLIPNLPPAGPSIIPSRINGDGSVVAGSRRDSADGPTRAWRWTQADGPQYLGSYRTNASYNNVRNVSRDGSTIVGDGQFFFGGTIEAWKWTETSGFTILPPAPGGQPTTTQALASNGNGSIVVGRDYGPSNGTRAVIWINEAPLALPTPVGYRSASATDLSDDASIIVGHLSDGINGMQETDAIWTADGGWVPALDYIRQQGVDVPSYFTGFGRFDVSSDGRTFLTFLTDTRTNANVTAVFVIPSPSGLVLLGVFVASTRRSRRCAAPHGSGC